MPIFRSKNKQGSRTINMAAYDGISTFFKGLAVNLTLAPEQLEIKARLGKQAASLDYSQIKNVGFLTEKEIVEKSKSVLGRAAVGGLLLGGLGATIGAVSGVGTKSETKNHLYLVINYVPHGGGDIAAISFESVGATLGLDKFTAELKAKCGIAPAQNNFDEPMRL